MRATASARTPWYDAKGVLVATDLAQLCGQDALNTTRGADLFYCLAAS